MESTSVKCYEIRNSTYETNGGQELIFKVPKNINLIDQKNTFLKFNIRLGGVEDANRNTTATSTASQQVKYCLDDTIGAEALIKSITVMTLDESKTLEQITNYNRLSKLIHTYADNSTKRNLKGMYEGRGERVCLGTTNQLWKIDNNSVDVNVQTTNTLRTRTIEVCLPLRHSGILGGNDLYPNMLTGLCIKIQLEDDSYKVLSSQGQYTAESKDPASNNSLNRMVGYSTLYPYGGMDIGGAVSTGATAGVDIHATDTNHENAGGNHLPLRYGGGVMTGTDPTGGNVLGCSCLPFTVGQTIGLQGASNVAILPAVEAVIASISFTGGNTCSLTFVGAVDVGLNTAGRLSVWVKPTAEKPNLTLSNVELIVGSVVPNDKERNAYMNSVKGGYDYNYYSYQNYPVNNSQNSTVISNLINCKLSKAKSILSTFEDVENATNANENALSMPVNTAFNPSQYHYIIDNLKTPSRNVSTSRLIRTNAEQGNWNAIHIKELSDAFVECNKVVQTFQPLKNNFVVARSLSRYNHSYNFLQQRGETRLNMDFVDGGSSTSKLNHNFVYHWKQMTVSPTGVTVNV